MADNPSSSSENLVSYFRRLVENPRSYIIPGDPDIIGDRPRYKENWQHLLNLETERRNLNRDLNQYHELAEYQEILCYVQSYSKLYLGVSGEELSLIYALDDHQRFAEDSRDILKDILCEFEQQIALQKGSARQNMTMISTYLENPYGLHDDLSQNERGPMNE
jgi:hypothetical protein